jgi:hypothetical protein
VARPGADDNDISEAEAELKAESDLTDARELSASSWDLVGRLWLQEWGWAERREWLERMLHSVVVSKGREPLSSRVQVELR